METRPRWWPPGRMRWSTRSRPCSAPSISLLDRGRAFAAKRRAKGAEMNRDIFEDLFVLELANNHLGKLERGVKIITDYSRVVRFNNVRAAIKLQFRAVEQFINKDFRNRTDSRYIKKPITTVMP